MDLMEEQEAVRAVRKTSSDQILKDIQFPACGLGDEMI